jgi:hypothetical protein
MSTKKIIGVDIDGSTEWHAIGIGSNDYDTMCGVDAHDPDIGHFGTVVAKRGQKITCIQCRAMWSGFVALRLRASDFEQ